MSTEALAALKAALGEGRLIPYLGPGVLSLADRNGAPPAAPEVLVDRLTAKATVPHKIRKNLTGAAQFIENFKHRNTVRAAMKEAFSTDIAPTALHSWIAALPKLTLVVHAWYDDLPQKALAGRKEWGCVQAVTQSEHFGRWVHYYRPDGTLVALPAEKAIVEEGAKITATPDEARGWATVLYEPLGSVSPDANFLVSDSDYVEVLTEIDIQTPIPEIVQQRRTGRGFLFLGCRFATQLERIFARQIIKRSSDKHWAVLPETPTRNEARFLEQYGIERLEISLESFMASVTGLEQREAVPA